MALATMPFGKPAFAIALVLLSLATTNVYAQDDPLSQLAELPQCGVDCFLDLVGQTPCELSDINCMCTDSSFEDLARQCVLATCSTDEAIEVSKFQASVCNQSYRSRKYELLIPLVIELPAWLCPWLHLYSRYTTVGTWALDDWLMLLVGLLYSAFLGIGQYVGQLAFGVDLWTLDGHQITTALKFFYIDESFYLVCLGLTKASVLFLYLRIFPGRFVHFAIYTTMGFVIIPTTVILTLQIIQCRPISHIWEGWRNANSEAECFDLHTLIYTAAGFTIVQDLVMLLLPLPSVYHLKVERRAKWGIAVMFSLGIFITFTSCIRLRYIAVFDRSINPTWDYTEVIIWTGLEVAVAIIVACMPAIGVILKRIWPGAGTRVTSSGYRKDLSKDMPNADQQGSSGGGLFEGDRGPLTTTRLGERNESQVELGLQLGDKARGNVHTEVSRYKEGERYSESVDGFEMKDNIGIAITTVTTVTVDARRDSFCPLEARQRWGSPRHSSRHT